MALPHTLADGTSADVAELDANFAYFADALEVDGSDVGIGGPAVVGVPLRLLRVGGCELRISSVTSGDPLLALNAEGVNGGNLRYSRASALLLMNNGGTDALAVGLAGAIHFPNIGTTASAANAFLASGTNPANQLLRSTSSLRYKTDVRNLPDSYRTAVMALRPVVYKSNAAADDPALDHVGLIAEEVAEHAPRLVHYTRLSEGGPLVPDGVQYDRVAVVLLAEVQALTAQLQAQQSQLNSVLDRLAALEAA